MNILDTVSEFFFVWYKTLKNLKKKRNQPFSALISESPTPDSNRVPDIWKCDPLNTSFSKSSFEKDMPFVSKLRSKVNLLVETLDVSGQDVSYFTEDLKDEDLADICSGQKSTELF